MQTMVNHNRDRLITVTRRAQVFLVSKWLLPASSVGAAVATRLFRPVLLNEQGDPVQHSLVGRPSFQSAALLGPLIQVSTQFAHQRSLRGKVALIALVERSTSTRWCSLAWSPHYGDVTSPINQMIYYFRFGSGQLIDCSIKFAYWRPC